MGKDEKCGGKKMSQQISPIQAANTKLNLDWQIELEVVMVKPHSMKQQMLNDVRNVLVPVNITRGSKIRQLKLIDCEIVIIEKK